jgi:pyrroline-5-carboxylate reductase
VRLGDLTERNRIMKVGFIGLGRMGAAIATYYPEQIILDTFRVSSVQRIWDLSMHVTSLLKPKKTCGVELSTLSPRRR